MGPIIRGYVGLEAGLARPRDFRTTFVGEMPGLLCAGLALLARSAWLRQSGRLGRFAGLRDCPDLCPVKRRHRHGPDRSVPENRSGPPPPVSGSQSLQVVGEPLDLPAEGLPLEQECANHLRRAPRAQALDLVAENVPVASGLAQYRIESLVQLLEGREEVRVELVNGAAPQRGSG